MTHPTAEDMHDHDDCDHQHPSKPLTKNEQKVFDLLCAHQTALKAYDILDHLKNQGVRAPMTVYRALDGLEHKGIVHKIDSINSYILCNHQEPHKSQIFFICDLCEQAHEYAATPELAKQNAQISDEDQVKLNSLSEVLTQSQGMRLRQARLELYGKCQHCIVQVNRPIDV